VAPLLDLPALGVATFGQSKLPAQTPYWESASVPGIFFAGTIGQGSAGLKKHGLPANSGAVHGARYNARVLARHVARTVFDKPPDRPAIAAGDLVATIVGELSSAPELWHQRAYLARVISLDAGVHNADILQYYFGDAASAFGQVRLYEKTRVRRNTDGPGGFYGVRRAYYGPRGFYGARRAVYW